MNSNLDLLNGRNYDILNIAKWFHNLTHYNFKFQSINNSTFDLQNNEYKNSLLVFIALPLFVLVVILLFYLIFIICICVCGTRKTRENIKGSCKVFIFLFGLVCGLTFIVGLYGCWKIHEGVDSVHNHTTDAVHLFNSIKNDTKNISNSIHIRHDVENINTFFKQLKNYKPKDEEIFDEVLKLSDNANHKVIEVNNKLTNLDVDSVPQLIKEYETIRWIVTLCVLCVLAIFGFFFTFGVYSRCLLTIFTIFGVISIIVGSAIVAISFSASVGISDFCYSAKPYIKSQLNNRVELTISDYYIDCYQNKTSISVLLNESKSFLNNAFEKINNFDEINQNIAKFCESQNCKLSIQTSAANIKSNLTRAQKLISNIISLVDCRQINNDLNESLNSICTNILEGIVMILSNGIAATFCFILLVFFSTFALR